MLNFALPNIDQSTVSLDDYATAKAVVIVFTCNHCPYAIAYEERLKEIDKTYGPQGIPLIAINSNDPVKYPQDSFENMIVRAREKQFGFPYVFDETQAVAHAYQAERTPHVYILQKKEGEFNVLYKGAIDDNYQNPAAVKETYLADRLDAILAGEELVYAETPAIGCTIKWK